MKLAIIQTVPLVSLGTLGLAFIVVVVVAALAGCKMVAPDYPQVNPMTPPATTIQLDPAEAMAMIEFCVDLDSEDDRQCSSRRIYNLRGDRISDWVLVEDSRKLYARSVGLSKEDAFNPAKNGFPPFGGAWTLWQKKNVPSGNPPVFALAFRGTVFSHLPSAVEDALYTTVAGRAGLQLKSPTYLNLTFATMPRAEVHEGFAYGLFSQLFDKEFGILPHLEKTVPPGSTLIITGHSQGASLATLAHAFFHYAALEGRYGIAGKRLNLRSYVFAQPKPGNAQFTMDFAQITKGGANSFTFNNSLDAIAALPPTHSFLFGAFEDCPPGKNRGFEIIRAINNIENRTKRFYYSWIEGKTAKAIRKLQKKEKDSFYAADELETKPGFVPESAVSQNYTSAGNLVPLTGLYRGDQYYGVPADQLDEFIQHHSTTYRRLLEAMFSYDVTTETSPELVAPPEAKEN